MSGTPEYFTGIRMTAQVRADGLIILEALAETLMSGLLEELFAIVHLAA